MINAQAWREVLEYLPPLVLLIFLALSPALMRFIQKRILLYQEKKKKTPSPEKTPKGLPPEQEAPLPAQSQPQRRVQDTPDTDPVPYRPGQSNAERETPGLRQLENLTPLQRAVVWSEILGPPGGKSS